jgi:hypothetical protein
MGTAAEHQTKARHNSAFLSSISDEYPDWLATAAFYVAVQLIEQLLAKRNLHSADHHQRNTRVRSDFQAIHKSYKALYNASLIGQYDPLQDALPIDQVRNVLISRHLEAVRSFVTAKLAKP